VKYLIISVVAALGVVAVLLATQKEKRPTISHSSQPAESLWLTDYKQAQERAKASNKPLLLEFTGSDWCPPCRQLQQQILSTPEFQQYARNNFVLVELDYPRAKVQAPDIVQQNQILAHRFSIEVFPTVILLNSEGKKIGELIGFDPRAGPEGYIATLEKFRKG
jgi:protein disulfide-isomerase